NLSKKAGPPQSRKGTVRACDHAASADRPAPQRGVRCRSPRVRPPGQVVDDPRRAGEERRQPSCPTLARGREHRQGVEKSDKLLPARGNWDASLTGFSKAMRRIRHELEADLGHEVPHWT